MNALKALNWNAIGEGYIAGLAVVITLYVIYRVFHTDLTGGRS